MKYRLTPRLNDCLKEMGSFEVDETELLSSVIDVTQNDYEELFNHPYTLLIEALPED